MRAVRERDTEPVALHDRALENIAFIRDTMERTTRFTAVSGTGGIVIGVVALAASALAWQQSDPGAWLAVWLAAATASFITSGVFIALKARRADVPLLRGPGRKFLLSLLPSILVGAALTGPLFLAGEVRLLPAVWLLLYGAAVMAAGAFSVPAIPVMGLCFLVVGAAALFAPVGTGDLFMATGFGAVHVVFGIIVRARYGG